MKQYCPCQVSGEVGLISVIVAAFLAINLITASLSPIVWIDEVMYTDPAINLRLFGKFVSSAWYAQTDQEFWSGYPPMYPLLLSGWLWLVPISPTGVRSLNFIIMITASVVLWLAIKRSGIIRSMSLRILFVVLILCGNSTAFSFRSGRPDAIGILIISLLALLIVHKRSNGQLILAFMLSALLPWAGLQLVAYVGVLGLIAAIVFRTELKFLVCVASGITAGGVALALFYIRAGTLTAFVSSALPHTALGSEHIGIFAAARELITTDYGTLFLFPLAVAAAIMVIFKSTNNRTALIFLILVCMIVPPALRSIGKFPIYYFWMTFIPISAIAVLVMDQFIARRMYSLIAGTFVCVSILIGLPTRIAVAMLDRDGRDYTKVKAYVNSVMTSRDIAFVDYAAYYPAKMEATRIYLPLYLKVISDSERTSVTIAILHRRETDPKSFLSTEFGGEWSPSAPDYPAETHQIVGRDRCVYFSSSLSLPSFILLTSPYSIWPPRCDLMVFRRKG